MARPQEEIGSTDGEGASLKPGWDAGATLSLGETLRRDRRSFARRHELSHPDSLVITASANLTTVDRKEV